MVVSSISHYRNSGSSSRWASLMVRFNPKAKLNNSRVKDQHDNPYESQQQNYLDFQSKRAATAAFKRRLAAERAKNKKRD